MTKFELDTHTVLRVIGFLVVLAVGYLILDVLLLLFIAYILMSAMTPGVVRLEKLGLPRWLGVMVIFVLVLTVLSFFITITLTPLIEQTQNLLVALPEFVRRFADMVQFNNIVGDQNIGQVLQGLLPNLSGNLTAAPVSIVRFGVGVFGGILDLIMVLVFTFYLAIERESVHNTIVGLLPSKDKEKLRRLVNQVDDKLGMWLRGQLLLMLVVGGLVYLGLSLIGIPFAVPLAVVAGLLEIIPIVGPIISSVPAILVALALSPIQALSVVFLYILVQQLENNLIVPRIMKNAVGLDPLVVILALMIGGRLAGPFGALLSVPTTAVLLIIYRARLDVK